MFELKWLYEIILIIYGLSIIGYFIDFIQSNQKVNKVAFWLLGMVWTIQTVFLLYEVLINRNFPIATLNDSLFFYAWILVTFSLIISRLFPTHFIVFFINVFGFFILLLYITSNANKQTFSSGIQFVHEILVSHITLAIVSYGFFTISFLFSLMFMIQYRFLKRKKGLRWMWRFGDLKQLDTYSFRAVTIGVPFLLIAIILGVVWAYVSKAEFYWFDMKTAGSILVLGVYVVYLLLRLVKGYQGKTISMFNVAAFLILIINFLLSSSLSNFHF
ncbi:HemX protein [Virgibacillus halotolerans]|uniref:cytochrome C assembly family protein n=1 Tax=Virgibacillus halotolerans TaxID=1071053 RepID=UPI0019606654|nr:cytochrome c biogenesis protein CcsA [Virgibacillus halotolerans]MBM7597796.1 HemX protein [Virgibacillus halotolerans]